MKVLVGCEESAVVREEFRKRGHDAWSCDLIQSRVPGQHLQMDIFEAIQKHGPWNLGIFFPPCTHLCVSGARWFPEKRKSGVQQRAVDFVVGLWDCGIEKIALENPIGILSTVWMKPTQIVQPWMFGHGETKATCLWLRNLPPLKPTDIVSGREGRIWKLPPSPDRARLRSTTLIGLAKAMAAQWG